MYIFIFSLLRYYWFVIIGKELHSEYSEMTKVTSPKYRFLSAVPGPFHVKQKLAHALEDSLSAHMSIGHIIVTFKGADNIKRRQTAYEYVWFVGLKFEDFPGRWHLPSIFLLVTTQHWPSSSNAIKGLFCPSHIQESLTSPLNIRPRGKSIHNIRSHVYLWPLQCVIQRWPILLFTKFTRRLDLKSLEITVDLSILFFLFIFSLKKKRKN